MCVRTNISPLPLDTPIKAGGPTGLQIGFIVAGPTTGGKIRWGEGGVLPVGAAFKY